MAEKHEKQQATSEAMNSLCIQPQTCFYNVCKKKKKKHKNNTVSVPVNFTLNV